MQYDLNEDQVTFATFLEQMLESSQAEFRTVEDWGRYEYGSALDAHLDENGFYNAALEAELGTVAAALMVFEASQVAVCLECGASALLRPFLGREVPRPLAVIVDDAPGAIRFLPQAKGLVSIGRDAVRYADLPDCAVRSVESLYAYPMGVVDRASLDWVDIDADPSDLRVIWQVAVAAELTGVLKAGMDSVISYVSERKQFGQPLGAFQGVQHRLATAAVEIEGAKWQMLKAAQSRSAQDASCALGYVQQVATRIGYDLHQFMGAMGLTLEHPLHRWTYRARLLRTEMGGSSSAYLAYAAERWGTP